MTKDQALKMAIEALENNKRTHYYCEDTWYSCPKHDDGCANEYAGEECDCGADETNKEFDNAIQACKEALEQPAQEPVAYITQGIDGYFKLVFNGNFKYKSIAAKWDDIALYTKE
jgi:hypothetical protein